MTATIPVTSSGPPTKAVVPIKARATRFTAVMGVWVIDSPRLDELGVDPAMIDLVRWHGAEEVEHRSVAFDVFQELCGSYSRRVVSIAGATVGLIGAWIIATHVLLTLDPTVSGKAARFSWKDLRAAGRDQRLPDVIQLAASVRDYMRRDHHPSQVGSTERALAYLASSPGVVRRGAAAGTHRA